MPDLLYEIGTEELPAGYIRPALDQLQAFLSRELDEARIAHGEIETVGTPRRLVVAARDAAECQADVQQEITGPPAKFAFDAQGKPTKAALGFARSQGVDVSEIELRDTPRGKYCAVRKHVKGRPAIDILSEVLPRITLAISFPKSMMWPSGERPFARPVRRLLALLGDQVIEFSLFGLHTGRTTQGHPFPRPPLSPGPIEIPNADFETYKKILDDHFVIVDDHERRAMICREISQTPSGFGSPVDEAIESLVDEVANLVEYPSVMFCDFDPAFLDLPDGVIKAAMMEHQRYFPVEGPDGLRPHFIVVSDRGPEHSNLIRQGNEDVLRARLADARFFYEQDRRSKLADRVEDLRGVAFLKDLGTYADKADRLMKLVECVARALGLDDVTTTHAKRAALLCKADLLTGMVGEFPGLQGEVGRIYALRDGEPEPVAVAMAEHYMPRAADGPLPATPAGRALGLAEKLDNLGGCFAMGLVPTGSADPYALRRQAQAVLRIIEESGRHLDVFDLCAEALKLLPEPHCRSTESLDVLRAFLQGRLFTLALGRSYPHDLINAALAPGFSDVVDFWMRMKCLRQLSQDPCWQNLVTAVERTFNITKSAPDRRPVDPSLFTEPLEQEVFSLYERHREELERLEAERRYMEASRRYAEVFAAPLHEFFDRVFVNVEDQKVRSNRLRLLKAINLLYSERIADLSQITTGVHKS